MTTTYSVRRRPRALPAVTRAVKVVSAFLTIFSALAVVGMGAFLITVGWGAR